MLLQISGEIAEKALEVSPYNALAFGFLVLVLGFGCYYFAKESKQSRSGYVELASEALKLLATVEVRLSDEKGISAEISKLRTDCKDLRTSIENKLEKIELQLNARVNK